MVARPPLLAAVSDHSDSDSDLVVMFSPLCLFQTGGGEDESSAFILSQCLGLDTEHG